jgi:4-alpha-glucanotransferase
MPKNKLKEYLFDTVSRDKWVRIGTQKRSGVLAPLFSIYSQESIGIGDLGDLRILIDWAHKTGNSIIQLLPMNEVGSIFCPYDSISSFALEPMYISLANLSRAKNKAIKAKIEDLRKVFSSLGANVDYAIKKEKLRLLWEVFILEEKNSFTQFEKFKEENAYWLLDFALYKVLKEHHKGYAWYDWEDKYKNRDKSALNDFIKEHEREIAFYMWLQWQLYEQFKSVKEYAATKKVYLKGDLPILVSRDSADVWTHPEFFKLEFAAGAPPDMYCAKGQRWGMPTYNWERIADSEYRYLKEKLKHTQNFYDILRIDHVVGLFRIWSIPYNEPLDNKGLNGFFDPREQSTWGEHGRNILKVIINNTNMLLCAEDLGIIPQVCTDTIKELGIPGNDVQRWVKDWKIKHDFLEPQAYRPLSVAMLSTHDTTNWPAWWENEAGTIDEDLFRRRCNERGIDYVRIKDKLFDLNNSLHGRLRWLDSIDSVDKLILILGKRKEELRDFIDFYENSYEEKEKLWRHFCFKGAMREESDAGIVKAALKISLDSSAIFCINTVFDWLYLADNILKGDPYQFRINTPGTISTNNWSLTLPLSLEALMKHKVSAEIKKMISASGRI